MAQTTELSAYDAIHNLQLAMLDHEAVGVSEIDFDFADGIFEGARVAVEMITDPSRNISEAVEAARADVDESLRTREKNYVHGAFAGALAMLRTVIKSEGVDHV